MTTVARTCIDLTRESGLAAGVVTTDDALHRGLTTVEELSDLYHSLRGRAGLSSGSALLDEVSPLSESPLESLSRLAMRRLSVRPEQQITLLAPDGRFLARADFFWRAFGVVGEADGRSKYTDDELWNEKVREARLCDAGLLVVRWDWSVARRPPELCRRIERTIEHARRLRLAGHIPQFRTA
ncbi:hypothetical protein ACSMXN_04785 [Jatrophihabitans sp. DSM 45814]